MAPGTQLTRRKEKDLNLQRANEQMKQRCMQKNNEDGMDMRMKPTR